MAGWLEDAASQPSGDASESAVVAANSNRLDPQQSEAGQLIQISQQPRTKSTSDGGGALLALVPRHRPQRPLLQLPVTALPAAEEGGTGGGRQQLQGSFLMGFSRPSAALLQIGGQRMSGSIDDRRSSVAPLSSPRQQAALLQDVAPCSDAAVVPSVLGRAHTEHHQQPSVHKPPQRIHSTVTSNLSLMSHRHTPEGRGSSAQQQQQRTSGATDVTARNWGNHPISSRHFVSTNVTAQFVLESTNEGPSPGGSALTRPGAPLSSSIQPGGAPHGRTSPDAPSSAAGGQVR